MSAKLTPQMAAMLIAAVSGERGGRWKNRTHEALVRHGYLEMTSETEEWESSSSSVITRTYRVTDAGRAAVAALNAA